MVYFNIAWGLFFAIICMLINLHKQLPMECMVQLISIASSQVLNLLIPLNSFQMS